MASQKWFKVTYADLNLAVIPISFALNQAQSQAVAKAPPAEVARFLAHIKSEEAKVSAAPSEYFYSVVVNFDIIKKAADGAVPIKLAAPGEAAQITVSIDDDKLPPGMTWGLRASLQHLKRGILTSFKTIAFTNSRPPWRRTSCSAISGPVPNNKKSPKVKFYNPNIIFEFDKHYMAKISKASPTS